MCKDVVRIPACKVETDPFRQETKAGRRKLNSALAKKHGIQLSLQGVKVQDVGGRIGDLRIGQLGGTPVRALLLFREIDAEQLPHEILEAMLVGIGAREAGHDLCA